jgi:hypothetical protein
MEHLLLLIITALEITEISAKRLKISGTFA